MVHDRPARIGRLTLAGLAAKVASEMFGGHALVGPQRDDHRDVIRPPSQRLVRGVQQQRQGTGPGAVGDH